jgi:hypothetical protein
MWSVFSKKLKAKKSSVALILLISSIVVLSLGFFISNCGENTGPVAKAAGTGSYTLDFRKGVLIEAGSCNNCSFISTGQSVFEMTGEDYTVEAWVKPLQKDTTTTNFGNAAIFSRGGDNAGFGLGIDISGTPGFREDRSAKPTDTPFNCAGTTVMTVGGGPYGGWYHVAAVKAQQSKGPRDGHVSGSHIDLYVNGALENTCQGVTRTPGFQTFHAPLTVEGECSGWGPGQILWGYWKINEGNGTTVLDGSGFGTHGETRKCFGAFGGGQEKVWPGGWLPAGSGRFDY